MRHFKKELARELHSQFYDLADVDVDILDEWEDNLTNDVCGAEEILEEYMCIVLQNLTARYLGKTRKMSRRACRSHNFRN